MADAEPSYRRRNIVLACVAVATIVAAVIRLSQSTPIKTPAGAAEPAPAVASKPAPAAAAGASIGVEVTYAGVALSLPDTAKIYIFVRPVGERMPLGVQTYAVRDLPVRVEFAGPSGAADARPVEVVARLSLTGVVAMQAGDVEVVSEPLRFGAAPKRVALTLGTATSSPPAVASASATPGDFAINVHLALASAVKLPGATIVFLIVRSQGGGPMPLAVKRLTVADLPADVSLSDADAMVAGRSLRDAGTLELVARASVSGNVKAGPGDYEGTSGALPVADASKPISLVINRAL